jgi:hypothetical protein
MYLYCYLKIFSRSLAIYEAYLLCCEEGFRTLRGG